MKKSSEPRKVRTHFEQIPVAVVKKVVGEDAIGKDGAGVGGAVVAPAFGKAKPQIRPKV